MNNPAGMVDRDGNLAIESALTYGVGLLISTLAITPLAIDACEAAGDAINDLAQEIRESQRKHSVYVLTDDSGTVQYVGRTVNVEKRKTAHAQNPARSGLQMEVLASGLTLHEARALEQSTMLYYHTINTSNKMNNQINSIAPKFWNRFKEIALGTINYAGNQLSNEILNWIGC